MTTLQNGVVLKPIPISPNSDYMAGSDGRIYSRTKYAGFGVKVKTDWYPLVGYENNKGYRIVSMCHKSKKVSAQVHRLICMAFHGTPQTKTLQVRHLDGNPSNNTPENLAWGTQAQNWADRKLHGRGIDGEKHPMSKLTDAEREHIRWAIQKGLCSQRHAARALGMSQRAIWGVCKTKPV